MLNLSLLNSLFEKTYSNPDSRYLLRIALDCLLLLIVYIALFLYQIGAPTPSSQAVYDTIQKKYAILHSINTKKIVLLGGSATYYSLRAEIIEKVTGIKTVNMGVHAGLGRQYILDRARTMLKPGDIVVLSLEYPLYIKSSPDPVAVDYILSRDPAYYATMPQWQQLAYFLTLSPLEVVLRAYSKLTSPPEGHSISKANEFSNANKYGDQTRNQKPPNPIQASIVAKIGYTAIDDLTEYSKGKADIKTFVAWCRKNNIMFIASFPSLMAFAPYHSEPYRSFLNSLPDFYRQLKVSVVGDPYAFMYERSNFFDTRYHLKGDAAQRHTYSFLRLLKIQRPELVP
jgi:hypothetical protein